MKEWILENFDVLFYVVSGIFSLITGSQIFSLVKTHFLRKEMQRAIDTARESKYYFTCPNCKKKVYLDEADLHMPDGALDNNLNGIPDVQE